MFIQEFLDKKSWEDLANFIKSPPYNCILKEDNNYLLIHYDMIKSDFSYPIVRECRGLIINKNTNKIVCYPFDKFFNYGEPFASQIDWKSAVVEEKIDGSLIKLWYDNNKWHISTMSTIDAKKATLPNSIFTDKYKSFYDLVIEAFKKYDFDYTRLPKHYTYMFELVSPYTKIIINYPEIDIYFLGVRNMQTLREEHFDLHLKTPKKYKMKSLQDVIKIANELSLDYEGYVVVDKYFNRIKVKSPKYVAMHHLKNNGALTESRVLDIIIKGEYEEFINYFPEFKQEITEIKNRWDKFQKDIRKSIKVIKSTKWESRKDLAKYCTQFKFSPILFGIYDNKITNLESYLQDINKDKLIKWI